MADTPDNDAPDDKPDASDTPDTPDDDKLGDPGKAALDKERKARRDAEKQLKELQTRLQEIEDKDKSEVEKLREQVAAITKERDDAVIKALRMEVAAEKGIPKYKYVTGATREEMEAAADEYLEDHPVGEAKSPPTQKPKPRLSGGSDPGDEPVDVKSLVDSIPSTV